MSGVVCVDLKTGKYETAEMNMTENEWAAEAVATVRKLTGSGDRESAKK